MGSKKKKYLKNKIIIAAVVVVVFVAIVLAAKYLKPNNQVAATVNGDKIMKEDVLKVYLNVPPEYRQVITAESILEGMIIEKLLVQEAEKKGISVSDEEVDAYVESVLSENKMTEEDLLQSLEENRMTLEDLKNSFKDQITIKELLDTTVLLDLEVDDKVVEDYYNENTEQFTTPESVKASHIVVNSSELAESIRRKALGGADFAKLAKEYSIGPSGPRGGTLGWFARGEMVGPFEDEAFATKVNGISKVVQTTFGYHVIKVEGKKEAVVQPFDDMLREQIKYDFKQQKDAAAVNIYTAQLEAAADIEIYMTTTEELEPGIKMSVNQPAKNDEPVQVVEIETAPVEESQPAVEEEESPVESSYGSVAECLASKGAKMYGSDESSTSNKQKGLFGDDFSEIDYTDCSADKDSCDSAGIASYPTWVIGGDKYVGKYSIDSLAAKAGC